MGHQSQVDEKVNPKFKPFPQTTYKRMVENLRGKISAIANKLN